MSISARPEKYNFLLMGSPKSGKSNLLERLISGANYLPLPFSSIGIDYKTKNLTVDAKKVSLHVWDAAGGHNHHSFTFNYVQTCHAIVIVFDLADLQSFENVRYYLAEILKIEKNGLREAKKIILVGNKSDLIAERQVEQHVINEFITGQDNRINAYIETSATQDINVEAIFSTGVRKILGVDTPFDVRVPKESKNNGSESLFIENDKHAELKNLLSNESPSPQEVLVARLQKYIHKIDNYLQEEKKNNNRIGFAHGFWFFKESRAANREANYLLAKKLLTELQASNGSVESIDGIFQNIDDKRNAIIRDEYLEEFNKGRGINSAEFNEVIARANYFVKL